MFPRAALSIMVAAAVSGCGDAARKGERPSEPMDVFYPRDPARKDYVPTIYHRRDPSRDIVTKLRPTDMQARFPTSYLRSISHFDQPYAKAIWDKVEAGLSLKDLRPLPVEKATPWREDIAINDLVMEIGGYSSSNTASPADWAHLTGGTAERDRGIDVVREGRLTTYFFADDLAGRPGNYHKVECYTTCSGTLTIPMSTLGRNSLTVQAYPNKVSGLGIDVTFHAGRINQWNRIKTTAICFLANAVPELDLHRLSAVKPERCSALRAVIRRGAYG